MASYYIDIDSVDLSLLQIILGLALVTGITLSAVWRWAGPGAVKRCVGTFVVISGMSEIDCHTGFQSHYPLAFRGTTILALYACDHLMNTPSPVQSSISEGRQGDMSSSEIQSENMRKMKRAAVIASGLVFFLAWEAVEEYTVFKSQYPWSFWTLYLLSLIGYAYLTTLFKSPKQADNPNTIEDDI